MVVTWTYSAASNTAMASGAGSTNFAALVAADTAGGWGKFTADATGTLTFPVAPKPRTIVKHVENPLDEPLAMACAALLARRLHDRRINKDAATL